MGFSRKEYWRGLPFPPPRDLPKEGWNPGLSPALAGQFYHKRHLGIGLLQCKARAGFLGLIHAGKSPEDLRNFFLREGLQSGPPSPFLLPFHTLRSCIQTAAPLVFWFLVFFFFFANRVPADPTATSSSIGFLMQAQLHCGRSRALTPLEPSVHVPARTLRFLQAWLLTSQVGSNYKNK